MRRNHELDAIRGIAAFVVLLHHAWLAMPRPWHDMAEPSSLWLFLRPAFLLRYTPLGLLVDGPRCVGLFFVLSGYVLAISLSGPRAGGYGRFVVRRLCRIYLPFAAIILVSAMVWGLVPAAGDRVPEASDWLSQGQWSVVPAFAVLLGHLAMIGTPALQSLDPPMWSLVVEMRVSLIFPLLYLVMTRYRAIGIAGVAVLYLLSCGIMSARDEVVPLSFGTSLLLTLDYMPLFVVGILLHQGRERLWHVWRSMPVIHRCVAILSVVGAYIAFQRSMPATEAALMAWAPGIGAHVAIDVTKNIIWQLSVAGGSVAAIMIALHSQRASRWLDLRPFQWLGSISYSLYLVHMPVLMAMVHALHGHMPMPAILAVSIILSLAVATLGFHWIEQPAIALGRHLTRRTMSAPVAVVP
ncbi:acyltransferase 3 [Gluconacetobacter diazotrophicus PA1 5]|uniref:Acyltransferase n=1 Tax=Gluconacetobacter diazotrophicus TaxID=33996 RepID=A0A7W4FDW0_GLUDI|nr:acyltransferase [Gluconacetobacter diazotrophicus]ACI50521.1 acyltransferase 3 [Gluconacetobacter diazotrophicus PA1 5]MBB2155714.1 acyltransferase [Gluconacetobacter diazotrophicus]TWB09353.1 peptidoglycan/LPS O-acetylase OafA/YrhL [Gluconacetobacter diazotrophicus]